MRPLNIPAIKAALRFMDENPDRVRFMDGNVPKQNKTAVDARVCPMAWVGYFAHSTALTVWDREFAAATGIDYSLLPIGAFDGRTMAETSESVISYLRELVERHEFAHSQRPTSGDFLALPFAE